MNLLHKSYCRLLIITLILFYLAHLIHTIYSEYLYIEKKRYLQPQTAHHNNLFKISTRCKCHWNAEQSKNNTHYNTVKTYHLSRNLLRARTIKTAINNIWRIGYVIIAAFLLISWTKWLSPLGLLCHIIDYSVPDVSNKTCII